MKPALSLRRSFTLPKYHVKLVVFSIVIIFLIANVSKLRESSFVQKHARKTEKHTMPKETQLVPSKEYQKRLSTNLEREIIEPAENVAKVIQKPAGQTGEHTSRERNTLQTPTKYNTNDLVEIHAPDTSESTDEKALDKLGFLTAGLPMEKRTTLVQNRCKLFANNKRSLDTLATFPRFLINTKNRLNICYHRKVVSTNIKRVLYVLDGLHNSTDPSSIDTKLAQLYNVQEHGTIDNFKTNGFLTMTFVREPLERLMSAYLDRRWFNTEHSYIKDTNMTFLDYLTEVLKVPIGDMNMHIYPYAETCQPCEIMYNYIGLQDTFDEDMKTILQDIHLESKVDIPEKANTGYTEMKTMDRVVNQYKDIPPDIIHQLWKKYFNDYFLYGFPYPSHLIDSKWNLQT